MSVSFWGKVGKMYIYTLYIYSTWYKLEYSPIYLMVILWLCCGYHLARGVFRLVSGYYLDGVWMPFEVMSEK